MRNPTATAGRTVVLAFCCLVAGVNAPNALVPIYAERFGLDSAQQSLLFVGYLAALIGVLVPLARSPRLLGDPRRARLGLLLALALLALSDALLALGEFAPEPVLAARLLGGVGVALGTSSAAGLAARLLGPSGRAAVGTGAVVGSLLGNLGGAAVATAALALGASPSIAVPLVHGTLSLLLALAVLLQPMRSENAAAEAPRGSAPLYSERQRIAGYLVGAMSWLAAGIVLALLPTAVRAAVPGVGLLEAMAPSAVLLAAAWAAQLALARRIERLRAWWVSILLVLGVLGLAGALAAASLPAAVLCCLVIGLAQGPAYNLGLVTVTHALAPALRSATASRYAAWSYGGCGAGVLLAGAAAATVGAPQAIAATGLLLAVAGAAATVLAGAPQVRAVQR